MQIDALVLTKRSLSPKITTIFLLILLLLTPNLYAADLTSINDVDVLSVSARKTNNSTLYVSFFYKNSRTDKLVFWRGMTSQMSCDAYELIGNIHEKRKGKYLGSLKNHPVSSFSQGVYIEIVTSKEKWGLVDCAWTYGGKYYYGEDTFIQY